MRYRYGRARRNRRQIIIRPSLSRDKLGEPSRAHPPLCQMWNNQYGTSSFFGGKRETANILRVSFISYVQMSAAGVSRQIWEEREETELHKIK